METPKGHFNKDVSLGTQIRKLIASRITGKDVTIKRGTPLALYVPFKRDDLSIPAEIRFANEKDIKMFSKNALNFKTMFKPGIYRKMQRERDKNVR